MNHYMNPSHVVEWHLLCLSKWDCLYYYWPRSDLESHRKCDKNDQHLLVEKKLEKTVSIDIRFLSVFLLSPWFHSAILSHQQWFDFDLQKLNIIRLPCNVISNLKYIFLLILNLKWSVYFSLTRHSTTPCSSMLSKYVLLQNIVKFNYLIF